jgi:hypothetical protein
VEVVELDMEEVFSLVFDEDEELVEVTHVSLHRVGRESLFQFQVLVVSAHNTLGVFGAES